MSHCRSLCMLRSSCATVASVSSNLCSLPNNHIFPDDARTVVNVSNTDACNFRRRKQVTDEYSSYNVTSSVGTCATFCANYSSKKQDHPTDGWTDLDFMTLLFRFLCYCYLVWVFLSSLFQLSASRCNRLSISAARIVLLVLISWCPSTVSWSSFDFRLSAAERCDCSSTEAHLSWTGRYFKKMQ